MRRRTLPANPLALDRSVKKGNIYIERLVKLIPIEVTGLYLFLVALGRDTTDQIENFLGVILAILIISLPLFYLPRVQNVSLWSERIIITISFIIWAANSDIDLFQHYVEILGASPDIAGLFQSKPAGMVLALWTFLLPAFYRGRKQS